MSGLAKDRFKSLKLCKDKLLQSICRLENVPPFSWLVEYRDTIASTLYLTWIAGCVYWLYNLLIIDARPAMVSFLSVTDSQDAMVFVFFGMFGVIYLTFFSVFAAKLIFNLVRGGIDSLFPTRWYSLVKSICLLICLHFAFIYIVNIKTAGLTAYAHVTQLVQTSKNHSMATKKTVDTSKFLEKIGNLIQN
jgi:hypothetical protein